MRLPSNPFQGINPGSIGRWVTKKRRGITSRRMKAKASPSVDTARRNSLSAPGKSKMESAQPIDNKDIKPKKGASKINKVFACFFDKNPAKTLRGDFFKSENLGMTKLNSFIDKHGIKIEMNNIEGHVFNKCEVIERAHDLKVSKGCTMKEAVREIIKNDNDEIIYALRDVKGDDNRKQVMGDARKLMEKTEETSLKDAVKTVLGDREL